VRHWISYHGLAINLAPDLDHFRGIVPCGLTGFAVTSLRALGHEAGMPELDRALIACFGRVFGQIEGA
jgi:lipoyl(octanoyl) transferase